MPYTVLTSNNELEGKFKEPSARQDSSSSRTEFDIQVRNDESKLTSLQNTERVPSLGPASTRRDLNIQRLTTPSDQLKTFKTFEISPYTQGTKENLPSERTYAEFRLTDRNRFTDRDAKKKLSLPFQISSRSLSSFQESTEQKVEDFESNTDPFSSDRQLYQHSKCDLNSIESNSSDDYDNEGTSRKRKTDRVEESPLKTGDC